MGIRWHQGIGIRRATLWLVPKLKTGRGEETWQPSDLSAVRAHPCTNRRYASPGFDPPPQHLDRAQETASAEHLVRAQEVKTSMLQVQSLRPRSGLTYRKSFSSYDRLGKQLL